MLEHLQYGNQKGFKKIASIYDEQTVSNRRKEEKALSFSSLSRSDSEDIFAKMANDMRELKIYPFEKKAGLTENPLELFSQAKHYISNKLGVSGETAHDLTSSVLTKAQGLQEVHGGELGHMVAGIVDHMDPKEIQNQVGALPMRNMTQKQVEEAIENRLLDEAHMDSFNADHYKKLIVQQARNFLTLFRQHSLIDIANAIFDVLMEREDFGLVKNISNSERLKAEIANQLGE